MSNAAERPSETLMGDFGSRNVTFDADELELIKLVVDAEGLDTVEELIRKATMNFVEDRVDDTGLHECPREGCDREFLTKRQLIGHLGSTEHALSDTQEKEYWCGYCGYGPKSWNAINAHHGSSESHNGNPICLDEEPSESDLVGVQLPDHKNPELLERLYQEYDGNVSKMCREYEFEVHQGTVRSWLIKLEIHSSTPQGTDSTNIPEYRDRDRLGALYEEHDGNISAMHRAMDTDVPYRTLKNWLDKLEIHDPFEDSKDDDSDVDHDPEADDDQKDETIDEVESFDELSTPDWLDESSFYAAVDMAQDIDELASILGFEEDEHEHLQRMVNRLGLEVR